MCPKVAQKVSTVVSLESKEFQNGSKVTKYFGYFCWKICCQELSKIAQSGFVDVEGTKEVKRMINLLAITVNLYHEIDADPSGSGSKTDRVRKQQMLIKYT